MRILAIVIPALFASACSHTESNASVSAATGTKTFIASDFDQVALRGSDNVEVMVGKGFGVTATGPESVLDELEITVEDGVLKVGRKNKSGWHLGWSGNKGERNAKIVVTMPAIKGAKLAGSGDMTIDHATTDAFEASVAGSGNLKVGDVQAKAVTLNVAGSGDLEVAGKAVSVDISGAGSGNVSAKALETSTADISLAGSGDASAHATGAVTVSLMGSGDVEISGTDDCKVSKMGSGDVRCTR